MPLVTLDQALAHLRADGDPDGMIALYLGAAERAALDFLGRQVFESQAAMDEAIEAGTAGERPMVVNDVVKAAILLFLGDLESHRENTVVGSGLSPALLPQGSRFLLQPYRANIGV